jgi:hypothetical protein
VINDCKTISVIDVDDGDGNDKTVYIIEPDRVVFEDLKQALDYLEAWRDGRAAAALEKVDACRRSTDGLMTSSTP